MEPLDAVGLSEDLLAVNVSTLFIMTQVKVTINGKVCNGTLDTIYKKEPLLLMRWTELHAAASEYDVIKMTSLVNKENLYRKDESGCSPLHILLRDGKSRRVTT